MHARAQICSIHVTACRLEGLTSLFSSPSTHEAASKHPWLAWRRGAPRSPSRPWLRASMRPEAGRRAFAGRLPDEPCTGVSLSGFLGGLFNSAHSDFQGDFPAQGQQVPGCSCGTTSMCGLLCSVQVFAGHRPGPRTVHARTPANSPPVSAVGRRADL